MVKLAEHQKKFIKVLETEVELEIFELKMSMMPKDLAQEIINMLIPITVYDL
jgi:hypothetical protein